MRRRVGLGVGWLLIFSLLLLLPVAAFCREARDEGLAGKWTRTVPPINLVHIDYGEINRRSATTTARKGWIRTARG
jgi:hypothetical protein